MDAPQTNHAETGPRRFPSQDETGSMGANVIALRSGAGVMHCMGSGPGRRHGASTGHALDKNVPSSDIPVSDMNDIGLDIDALLGSAPIADVGFDDGLLGLLDRRIARSVAEETRTTTLLIMGNLQGPRCLPVSCEDMCPSFKLISMRRIGASQIAMFSVPVEREMAELFEEIDGRRGIRAIAYDGHGRTKESYIL